MRLIYANNYNTGTWDYRGVALAADYLLIEGFIFNLDGSLNSGSLKTPIPSSSVNLYKLITQAGTTRAGVCPVFQFPSGTTGAQINTMLSTSTSAQTSYATIAGIMENMQNCGGVSFDFEDNSNLWIVSFITWVSGLISYLANLGLPTFTSNYLSPSYAPTSGSQPITVANWQAAINAVNMTLIPTYLGPSSGPGPVDPWPQVLNTVTNLMTEIGAAYQSKVAYLLGLYSDIYVCASTTPLSPNLSSAGGSVFYSAILNAQGEVSTPYTPYDCECVAVPVTSAQYATMEAANQLPAGTNLPLWYQYYYNPIATHQARLATLLANGWTNVALFAAGYEGSSTSYISALTVFPSGKKFINDLSNAVSARLDPNGNVWVLSTNCLTQYTSSGSFIQQINAPLSPQELTIDGNGNVYVLSGGSTVTVFDQNFNLLSTNSFVADHIDYDLVSQQLYATSGLMCYALNPAFGVTKTIFLDSVTSVKKFRVSNGFLAVIDGGTNNFPKILSVNSCVPGTGTNGASFETGIVAYPGTPAKDLALTSTELYVATSAGQVQIFTYTYTSGAGSLKPVAWLNQLAPPTVQLIDVRGSLYSLVNVTNGVVTTSPSL